VALCCLWGPWPRSSLRCCIETREIINRWIAPDVRGGWRAAVWAKRVFTIADGGSAREHRPFLWTANASINWLKLRKLMNRELPSIRVRAMPGKRQSDVEVPDVCDGSWKTTVSGVKTLPAFRIYEIYQGGRRKEGKKGLKGAL